ncbi:MAG: hypothetical protein IFK94_15190 [Acidobacteria bacterium]|uniref:Uncharacterized protein n=1 Tax=Candidatus Polarisedimenticola svalbardensis TaxID=2886004 RepID=A0A8J7C2S8_9BACT|nr:hypothetical protein [Candidatus Polarisedimenticola svalbardensis]
MIYDPGLGKTILFSGNTDAGTIADTWEWDGQGWTELFLPVSPPARNCTLAYDTVRQKVLLHGGTDRNDTWLFDGNTWGEIAISGLPDNRYRHALTYDRSSEMTVLYGGFRSSIFFRDTWHLTEIGWSLQASTATPSASNSFQLAHDPSAQETIGFSGYAEGFVHMPDVHHYEGEPPDWVSLPVSTPLPRQLHGWTYAQPLGGFVLFGGSVCCFLDSAYLDNDMWVYNGSSWTRLLTSTNPEPRNDFSMSFDKTNGNLVLYGGMVSASMFDASDDTWLYDGSTWTHYQDGSPPGQRFGHGMAYDESRGVTVLFGGAPDNQEGVTWEFDGTAWNARPTPFQPETGRRWTPLTYDSIRKVVLMFGGEKGYSYNDTWAYGADPDLDGIVGLLDNCVDTVNPEQVDEDGDAAGDVCDCAVTDPGAFSLPVEVNGLQVNGAQVSWEDQAGIIGLDARYDLVSGGISDLLSTGDFSLSSCLGPDWATPSFTDNRVPALGDGFYYLVRSKNVCGVGTYGDHGGLDAGSPCP